MNLKSRGIVFRIINRLSSYVAPGYGSCGCCGGHWNIVEMHVTRYAHNMSFIALCEACWRKLTPEERVGYYIQELESLGAFPAESERPRTIIGAVMMGK